MRHWILLILFAIGLLINLKGYFYPVKVESSKNDTELAAKCMAMSKKYCGLSAIIFLVLVLDQIQSIVTGE